MEAITIGLDIAKSVFQVHGIDPKRTLPSLVSFLMLGWAA